MKPLLILGLLAIVSNSIIKESDIIMAPKVVWQGELKNDKVKLQCACMDSWNNKHDLECQCYGGWLK